MCSVPGINFGLRQEALGQFLRWYSKDIHIYTHICTHTHIHDTPIHTHTYVVAVAATLTWCGNPVSLTKLHSWASLVGSGLGSQHTADSGFLLISSLSPFWDKSPAAYGQMSAILTIIQKDCVLHTLEHPLFVRTSYWKTFICLSVAILNLWLTLSMDVCIDWTLCFLIVPPFHSTLSSGCSGGSWPFPLSRNILEITRNSLGVRVARFSK